MRRRRCLLSCVCATVFLWAAIVTAAAQEIGPPRPFEIIVPWGQGGSADKLARKIAPLMEPALGPLRVTNIAGASGQKGLAQLKAAPADGRTLAILTGDTFGVLASRPTDVRLDNLAAVAILMRQPSAFLVNENGRFKTWDDVVAAAKTTPVRVAIAGPRSADELTINYFVRQGLRLVSVPHTKPGERHRALLGGYAERAVRAGRRRALLCRQCSDAAGVAAGAAARFSPQGRARSRGTRLRRGATAFPGSGGARRDACSRTRRHCARPWPKL